MGGILRSPSFWLVIFAIFLVSCAVTGFTNNASAFYQSIGNNAMSAALCISIYNGVMMAWGIIFGALTDKKGPAVSVTICGLIGAAVLLVGPFLSGFSGAAIIAAVMGSINFSGMLGALCFPRMFGTAEAANLVGFGQAAGAIGPMVGAPLAGFIYDATGSYATFLTIAAVMTIACVVITVFATRSRDKKSTGDAKEKL